MKTHYPICLVFLACLTCLSAWEPSKNPPALLPRESWVLPDDLEITPWATSPAFFNPTNIDIDHRGRIWVTEGINYRKKMDRQPAGDRIVILEDTDGDGTCDKSQVFWQDPELVSPLGIAVFDNVVILSQPPNLLKLTDVNRDGRFDPANGDIREVLLTGFNGKNHDHSLHSLTAGPDGKWMFSQGNTCGVFTDRSGKTFRIGSAYYQSGGGEWPIDTKAISGQASDDGFVYVGGFSVRMNPDGTHAEIIGHNYRNSYEQTITSLGHVFQNDNDDPPACRTSHVLEHGSAGFFSPDGKRFWYADIRPGQSTPVAEWRQDDPGSIPAGDVYGGGSPTGITFYENGALGEKYNGTLLSCEAARNVVFSYQPEKMGAGFALHRQDFITTNPGADFKGADFTGDKKQQSNATTAPAELPQKYNFRPSDICVGPDGAIYLADWTDGRVGGHKTYDESASGIIYRIAPKGFKSKVPTIDLTTTEGAVMALKSPAVNVRYLGFEKIKQAGEPAFSVLAKVLADQNPYLAARAIWLLPYLGKQGQTELNKLITDTNASTRLTAFRAIRRTDGLIDSLPYAKDLASDPAPEIRAEAALSVRYRPFSEAKDILVAVANGYDGKDRSYLESLGLGAGHHCEKLYQVLSEHLPTTNPVEWPDSFARLTWRLMPEAAISALKTRATSSALSLSQRKFALDTLPFIRSQKSADAIIEIAMTQPDLKEAAVAWLVNRSEGNWQAYGLEPDLIERGLIPKPAPLVEAVMPPKPANSRYSVEEVLALTGDAARGKITATRCIICHQINDLGTDYGPSLKGFGSIQSPEVVARSIIDPSFEISHGYEGRSLEMRDGKRIHGKLISEGQTVVITSMGGFTQHVPKRQIIQSKPLNQSLMLSADQLNMSAQDVADVLAWMKEYK